jgi:hypothetical protein
MTRTQIMKRKKNKTNNVKITPNTSLGNGNFPFKMLITFILQKILVFLLITSVTMAKIKMGPHL